MAAILKPNAESLHRCADALREGRLVAVPTETVYGLAAHALDETAVAAIFAAKGRPKNDPLIVHVDSRADVERVADTDGPAGNALDRLAERFWPGPLTVVLPRRERVSDLVTASLPTVAVRVPAHPVLRTLLKECALPLAAPSANPFGYISPTTAAHVEASLGERIELILDGGPCAVGVESTILSLADPARPLLLRPGTISRHELAETLDIEIHLPERSAEDTTPEAPGRLSRHYAPRTPLVLVPHGEPFPSEPQTPAIFVHFARQNGPLPPHTLGRVFSESGEVSEAARGLFALLRELDGTGAAAIYAEMAPEDGSGLATAFNDRLRRAAARA